MILREECMRGRVYVEVMMGSKVGLKSAIVILSYPLIKNTNLWEQRHLAGWDFRGNSSPCRHYRRSREDYRDISQRRSPAPRARFLQWRMSGSQTDSLPEGPRSMEHLLRSSIDQDTYFTGCKLGLISPSL